MSADTPTDIARRLNRIREHLNTIETDYPIFYPAVYSRPARTDIGRMSRNTTGIEDLLVAGINEHNGREQGQARARNLVMLASHKLRDIEAMTVAAETLLRDAARALETGVDDGAHLERCVPDPNMRAEIKQAEAARDRRNTRMTTGTLPWTNETTG